ncbi:hypothetical protein R5R35_009799 [Gryllus longicercus]|uniref:Uncharacterized protein n=1 Tax=Gryllus longicercus TaxID=2509291 RepID=A0AAN9Z7H5_9ORTH
MDFPSCENSVGSTVLKIILFPPFFHALLFLLSLHPHPGGLCSLSFHPRITSPFTHTHTHTHTHVRRVSPCSAHDSRQTVLRASPDISTHPSPLTTGGRLPSLHRAPVRAKRRVSLRRPRPRLGLTKHGPLYLR